MEEYDELSKTVQDLQRLLNVANQRIERLEQKVTKILVSSPTAQGIHGPTNPQPDEAKHDSSLGKSLGQMRERITSITRFPLRLPEK